MKIVVKLIVFLLLSVCSLNANLRLRDSKSTIHLSSDTILAIDNQINNYIGRLEKDTGAQLVGASIDLTDGILVDGNKKFNISGTLCSDYDNVIWLTGGKVLRGNGLEISQEILVSGNNNRIEGEVVLSRDLQLFDASTTVTLALTRCLNQDVYLNNGKIVLEEDLNFVASKHLIGPGTVSSNGRWICFGSKEMTCQTSLYFDNINNLELGGNVHLAGTWTFSGQTNKISGKKVTLFLEPGGNIIVERGSVLLLDNVDIQKVAGTNITCLDDSATLFIRNSAWYLDQNYSFSFGHLYIDGDFDVFGDAIFTYQTNMTSTIAKNSSLILEQNMTFSYDPYMTFTNDVYAVRKDLLCFADASSCLYLNNATVHATRAGMNLTKGQAVIDGFGKFETEMSEYASGFIEFGDLQNADNDFSMNILRGSALNFVSGTFLYKNLDQTSWSMNSVLSSIVLESGSALYLQNSLDLGTGRLLKSQGAGLVRDSGTMLLGSVDFTR